MMSFEIGPPVVATAVSDFVLSAFALSALPAATGLVESFPVVSRPPSAELGVGVAGVAEATAAAPPKHSH